MSRSSTQLNEISVWHAANSSDKPGITEIRCEGFLDDADQARADLFRRPTTRNQHVIGRGMARLLLSTETIDPKSIRFGVEKHGKPYVKSPSEAQQPFNVTHTDGLVMCAIREIAKHHRLIGLDVERLDRRTDTEIADRYFSEPEIEYLQQFQCEERRRVFLRIWTLKESFIKAIGTGLQTPLADFAFEQIDSDTPTIRMLDPKFHSDLRWQLLSIEPRPGFIGAIAVAPADAHAPVSFQLQHFEPLVGN